MAFHNFGPAVRKAKRRGWAIRKDSFGDAALHALIELSDAKMDRTEQQIAEKRYGG